MDAKPRCHDVVGDDLFKKETDMKLFIGRKLVTETGDVGIIDSAFGGALVFATVPRRGCSMSRAAMNGPHTGNLVL